MFFGYKVSTQQHFKTRLFWKTAKKLRIHALLEMPAPKLSLSHAYLCPFLESSINKKLIGTEYTQVAIDKSNAAIEF